MMEGRGCLDLSYRQLCRARLLAPSSLMEVRALCKISVLLALLLPTSLQRLTQVLLVIVPKYAGTESRFLLGSR